MRRHEVLLRQLSGLAPSAAAAGTAGGVKGGKVVVSIDFRSPWCYIALAPTLTVPRDYNVALRWRAVRTQSSRTHGGVGTRRSEAYVEHQRLRDAHEVSDVRRYAALQGITILADWDPGDCTAPLLGLMWASRSASPEAVSDYIARVFHRLWVDGGTVDSLGEVGELLHQSGVQEAGFLEFASPGGAAAKELDDEQVLMGVPSYAYGDERWHGRQYISHVRYALHAAGLARSPEARSDVSCAWRAPEPLIDPCAVGMPQGPRKPQLTYWENSKRWRDGPPDRPVVDVYLDIKSPHAMLTVEMAQALEHDFSVAVNLLPFDIRLGDIYGRAEVGARNNKVQEGSSTRTTRQQETLRQGYRLIKLEGALRGYRMYGTRKIWETRLALLAMLYARQHGGRAALDKYLEAVYRPFWRRELDIEDPAVVSALLRSAGVSPDGFADYCAPGGPGDQALGAARERARGAGVFGVPTFLFGGELFFGKEQVSLLRLRMQRAGLALRGEDTPVDVPFFWRPGGIPDKLS
eukprot:TRINITY_DN24020_c0_g1_i1.p1 TRINITY_DN24020_c0_g1~~TRINITY_DN24020_c0_g1_i1.p1  ORF type:complete len:545 (+),score=112.90 TRINITY_DN24020_c0_g1_i1:78-1637(+)